LPSCRFRRFAAIMLRTRNPAAARLYEALGFAPVKGGDATTHRLALD
jgi:predicted GNAT family acetyltransferase